MKEIKAEDLIQYVNPMAVATNPAITVATDGKETNGLTIGWAGFGVLWQKLCATVYIHKDRYSKHIFDGAEYFAVCFFEKEQRKAIKYFGTVSGRDENKMEKGGLTPILDDIAPYFEESSVVVLCRKMGQCDFDADSCDAGVKEWYQKDGVHTQYMGEIMKVLVKE